MDDLDFDNFKGIYYGDKHEKYQDPVTGCHFQYNDLCKRLTKLREKRKILDVQLGLKSPTRSNTIGSAKQISPPEKNFKPIVAKQKFVVKEPTEEANGPTEKSVEKVLDRPSVEKR